MLKDQQTIKEQREKIEELTAVIRGMKQQLSKSIKKVKVVAKT